MRNLISMEKRSYNFSVQLNSLYSELYDNLKILKEENQRYIIYGDGIISKIVQNYLPSNIVTVVDINSQENHPSKIHNFEYDKIIISVFGRENEIVDYLINTLGVTEDKIFILSPYFQDIYINSNKPLILVYQLGKVGSSSIYHSLLKTFNKRQVFHIHLLSQGHQHIKNNDNIRDLMHPTLKVSQNNVTERVLGHLEHNYFLGSKLLPTIKNNPSKTYKIITGIREPILQCLSTCFQGIHDFDFIDSNGVIKKDLIITTIKESLKTNFYKKWYDLELKTVFGIDIFSYNFDTSQAYFYIKKDNLEIILYKLEYLDEAYSDIFNKLFPNEKIPLENRNEAKNKPYYKEYKEILQKISFSENELKEFYNQPNFIGNFYSQEDINNFINKWKN